MCVLSDQSTGKRTKACKTWMFRGCILDVREGASKVIHILAVS